MNLNIDALEASFDQVALRGDELVETFYERLFTVAPAVRPLFAATDFKRQKGNCAGRPTSGRKHMTIKLGAVVMGATALTLALSSTASADPFDDHGAASARQAPAANSVAKAGPILKAGTSVTIGQTAANTADTTCPPLAGVQQSVGAQPGYTTPSAGVVTRLSYNANAVAGQVRAVFWKPSATPGHWTLATKSALASVTPSTLNSIPTRLPVPAGVILGIQTTVANMNCAGTSGAGDAVQYASTFNPDTSTEMTPTSTLPNYRWNISAVLESDVDGDGYGDVTQDACPQSATTQAACPDPDTIVTNRPARISTNRNVKIKFRSTIAGSTFMCSRDGRTFRPCTSPFSKRFGPGRHKVKIEAVSPAGIVDPTPARVKFRSVRPH